MQAEFFFFSEPARVLADQRDGLYEGRAREGTYSCLLVQNVLAQQYKRSSLLTSTNVQILTQRCVVARLSSLRVLHQLPEK